MTPLSMSGAIAAEDSASPSRSVRSARGCEWALAASVLLPCQPSRSSICVATLSAASRVSSNAAASPNCAAMYVSASARDPRTV